MRTTSTLTALALAGAVLGTAATATTADAAGDARCDGKKATIVSKARKVVGTERSDVIVALGSRVVRGLGGSDRICVHPSKRSTNIDAGAGDDVVRIERGSGTTRVILGEGDDTFVGGKGRDQVYGYQEADHSGADVFRTRGGSDSVWQVSAKDGDRLSLGGGDDYFSWRGGPDHTGLVPQGGAGDDQIYLAQAGDAPGALRVDNTSQTATIGGAEFARWENFEVFSVWGGQSQSFVGSAEDEEVHFLGDSGGPGPRVPSASMGAGDDVISPWEIRSWATDAFAGGPGADVLDFGVTGSPSETYSGNLITQRIDFTKYDGAQGSLAFTGMEGIKLSVPAQITLTGDSGDNVLHSLGCVNTINAGGGDDEVKIKGFWDDLNDGQCVPRSTVRGGGGADEMVGSWGPDRLVGDRGRDVADGGKGKDDVCKAEVERRCEK